MIFFTVGNEEAVIQAYRGKKARVNAEMNSNKLMDENREQFPSRQVQRILLSEKASLKKICA